MLDGDELAGIASQFGALTRPELVRAVEELAFKRGEEPGEGRVGDAIDRALAELRLVAVERAGSEENGDRDEDEDGDGDRTLLVPGPTAFPRLPAGAEDLPHILDAGERSVPEGRRVEAAERRLRAAAATAVADGDRERIADLLDATYDLESWGPGADVASVRERLDAALAENPDGATNDEGSDGTGSDGAGSDGTGSDGGGG